jgi:hypothetical protein
MAVLVEGISVIVRRDAIERKLKGGWATFVGAVPNADALRRRSPGKSRLHGAI